MVTAGRRRNLICIGLLAVSVFVFRVQAAEKHAVPSEYIADHMTDDASRLHRVSVLRILNDEQDIRLLYVGSAVLEQRVRDSICIVEKFGDKPGITNLVRRKVIVDEGTTLESILTSIDPQTKRRLIDTIGTQPQIKVIKKNAILQSEWLRRPDEDFLRTRIHAGDIVFLAPAR